MIIKPVCILVTLVSVAFAADVVEEAESHLNPTTTEKQPPRLKGRRNRPAQQVVVSEDSRSCQPLKKDEDSGSLKPLVAPLPRRVLPKGSIDFDMLLKALYESNDDK